jgi:hypothetical protein
VKLNAALEAASAASAEAVPVEAKALLEAEAAV